MNTNKIWNKTVLLLTGAAAAIALATGIAYAKKVEDSELVNSLVAAGQTFEGEDLKTIFLDNMDAYLDFYMPNGVPRVGEQENIVRLRGILPQNLSYRFIGLNELLLKLNLNPGINENENPLDIYNVNNLLKKNSDYVEGRKYAAILLNRVEGIESNPNSYRGLTLEEATVIDSINQKIDYLMTFATTVDKSKAYSINILDHNDTPEAREQAIKSAARTTIMDMLNAAYADEVITNEIDDATGFSSQLSDLLENERSISLHFADSTGKAILTSGNKGVGEISLDFERIIAEYNNAKQKFEKTGEQPEVASVEKKFNDYVHPEVEGTQIKLGDFKDKLNDLERQLSNLTLPDVPSEDIELYARRLNEDVRALSKKGNITLGEMNYRDQTDPQKRGYALSSRELYNDISNLPESQGRDQLLKVAEQYASLTSDINRSGEEKTGVVAVKEEQKKREAERTPELNELVEKLQKERGSVYVGPVIVYKNGSLSYGGAFIGKWKNWGIGLEAYHNESSDVKDNSEHNQDMGLGFTGDLTDITRENENQTMINAFGLRRLDEKGRFWLLFGGGANYRNKGISTYQRTIVEKDGNKISDVTQPSGTSEKKTYPVFTLGLDGYIPGIPGLEDAVRWQVAGFYSNKKAGANFKLLFDLGKLTGIGN